MTTCTESVPSLLKQLCVNSQKNPQRAFLTQPTETREQINKPLQRKTYDSVFGYLKSQQCIDDKKKDERVSILSYVLQLRYRKKFDEANRLEALLDSLLEENAEKNLVEQECVRSVLKLLVTLAEFPSQTKAQMIGNGESKYPVVGPHQSKSQVFPFGPQCYGDSQISQPDSLFYMHYPRKMGDAESKQKVKNLEGEIRILTYRQDKTEQSVNEVNESVTALQNKVDENTQAMREFFNSMRTLRDTFADMPDERLTRKQSGK